MNSQVVSCLLGSLFFLAALNAQDAPVADKTEAKAHPPLSKVPFFAGQIGKWKGKGESAVSGLEGKLTVSDTYECVFADDEKVMVQTGEIALSNGGGFKYRWIFGFNAEIGAYVGKLEDSNGKKNTVVITLNEDGTIATSVPVESLKGGKGGLYAKTTAKADGNYSYDAEIRDAEGKVVVKTHVDCEK